MIALCKEIVLHWLRDTACSRRRYILRTWAIAFLPAIAIGALVQVLFGSIADKILRHPPVPTVLSLVVVAPLLETLVMMLIFAVIRLFTSDARAVVLWSAGIWAVLHSLAWPPSGLIVFWPFMVFSIVFLTWEKISRRRAFLMTAATHAVYNSIPALIVCLFA